MAFKGQGISAGYTPGLAGIELGVSLFIHILYALPSPPLSAPAPLRILLTRREMIGEIEVLTFFSFFFFIGETTLG